ncbi:MAG: hypothetical protein ACLFUF_02460 [Opitutales bacterium]
MLILERLKYMPRHFKIHCVARLPVMTAFKPAAMPMFDLERGNLHPDKLNAADSGGRKADGGSP